MGSYEDGYANAPIQNHSCYGKFPPGKLQTRCNNCNIAVECYEATKKLEEDKIGSNDSD